MFIVDKDEIKAGFALAEKEGIIDRYIKYMFPNGLPEKYRKKKDNMNEFNVDDSFLYHMNTDEIWNALYDNGKYWIEKGFSSEYPKRD